MDIGTRWKAFEFRWAMESEWSSAMKLVWKTFLKFEGKDYTQEGIRHFFDFITDDKLFVMFLKGEYQMMVALDRGHIIGVGSIRKRGSGPCSFRRRPMRWSFIENRAFAQ